ncbi:hypothetical protein [Butyrivibrio sp. XBB1001]|uniref:hypothetical protein n=1 Tax=Butyrivibrio sp. XBB1001 TaxID=1280682 RepID=UPI00047D2543|nr:hypothetical protein [Butyrivibrio sp. XBB1001]
MFSAGKEDGIDFERLRKDLIDEFGAQMVTITGTMGYSDMCDAQNASEDQLLEMAKREGININKYRRLC